MGVLVPKGSTVAETLAKKSKENVYLDFIERFVLTKDRKTTEENLYKIIIDMLIGERRELTIDEQKELAEKYRKVADEILETIKDQDAEIATFTFSKGGQKTSLEKNQLQNLKEKDAKVEYTAIMVNGVVVLEPIGQSDNATYVIDASSKEKQDVLKECLEDIKNVTRKQAQNLGLMYSIRHDIYQNERI